MYGFMSEKTKNKLIGTLAAVLYMSMPYHLNDMYIRNALGEFLSYIFIPLVFRGIDQLLNQKNGNHFLVVGATGLILTHNLMTLLTAIFASLYLLIHIKQLLNKKCLLNLLITIGFILGITSFFWIPALETLNFADYEVYQKNSMATTNSFINASLSLKELLFTSRHSTFIFEIGIPIIVILLLSFLCIPFLTKKFTNAKEYFFFLSLGILCVWMSTKYFPWEFLGNYFNIIQFPWRLLVFSNFFFSIICSINLGILLKNFRFFHLVALSIIIIFYLATLIKFLPTSSQVLDIKYHYLTGISVYENVAMPALGKGEYLPVNSNKNRSYLFFREDTVSVLSGKR